MWSPTAQEYRTSSKFPPLLQTQRACIPNEKGLETRAKIKYSRVINLSRCFHIDGINVLSLVAHTQKSPYPSSKHFKLHQMSRFPPIFYSLPQISVPHINDSRCYRNRGASETLPRLTWECVAAFSKRMHYRWGSIENFIKIWTNLIAFGASPMDSSPPSINLQVPLMLISEDSKDR